MSIKSVVCKSCHIYDLCLSSTLVFNKSKIQIVTLSKTIACYFVESS